MVELSDDSDLFHRFVTLPAPKLFMYGCQNNSPSYLEDLRRNGVQLAEIAHSAHFPMYSNPTQMWQRIADFITAVDRARNDVVPAH
jgi:pimeloyl-ACP methyl ester carboxylesterase